MMMLVEKTDLTYEQTKENQAKELNAFTGIFFAFSNDQFAEGMEKLGLDPKADTDKVCRIVGGGVILKTRAKAFGDMFKRHNLEDAEARKSEKYLLESLVYELRNHEYGYTYDTTDTLEALGLDADELPKGLLKKACRKALEGFVG